MKKTLSLFSVVIAMLLLTVSANAQVYILNEDFSSANGTTPPNGWSNIIQTGATTDLWHFDNPGNRIVNYPVSPKFAIFDSRNYSSSGGPEVAILESKYFDASVSSNILFQFDHYFVAGNGGRGYVDVFNGVFWNNIFLWRF